MRRKWIVSSSLAAAGLALALIVWHTTGQDPARQPAKADGKADSPLPIRHVILLNSGVGYFQREGEVTGDAQVELSFPVGDINDLLKSLTLEDTGGGHVNTVNYDSHDPVDKVLHSFALDLNGNPTFSQLLNQARGEKVEVTLKPEKTYATPVRVFGKTDSAEAKPPVAARPPERVTGTIIGMEVQKQPKGKDQFIDVDFLNLVNETGISSIAMTQVQTIRFLNPVLDSELQRALRVVASSHDKQKKAVTLNFSGQGKRTVKVGYVVEHPIWRTSYRLVIEPNGKLFLQGWAIVENTSDEDWKDVSMSLVSGRPISFKMNLYEPLYIPRPTVEPELFASLRPPVYDSALITDRDRAARAIARAPAAPPALPAPMPPGMAFGRAEGKDMRTRDEMPFGGRRAGEVQKKMAEAERAVLDLKQGVASIASASAVGEYYQYVIKHKISLPRQKSALLPILNEDIEGAKVSIYNPAVQAKYPLLGLRLKNSAGEPLNQGPITVYEDNSYSGDTRILDLNAGEVRLLSYALDQSVEIKKDVKDRPSPEMHFQIGTSNLTASYKMRETSTYTIKNRAKKDRTVIIEHAIRGGWDLVEPKQATEKTRDLYRFELTVPAGKAVTLDVVEEQPRVDYLNLLHEAQFLPGIVGIGIKALIHTDPEKLQALRIEKGYIIPKLKVRESKTYFVQNNSDIAREFTVDHLIPADWIRLPQDGGKAQRGPDSFRFTLKTPVGTVAKKEIIEERTFEQKGGLVKDLGEEKLREYLASPVPSPAIKDALTKVLNMNAKLAESNKHLAEQGTQLKQLTDDQARLRENLKIIPMNAAPYKTFLDKFVSQETEIEGHQKEMRQIQATVQRQQRELDAYIGALTVE